MAGRLFRCSCCVCVRKFPESSGIEVSHFPLVLQSISHVKVQAASSNQNVCHGYFRRSPQIARCLEPRLPTVWQSRLPSSRPKDCAVCPSHRWARCTGAGGRRARRRLGWFVGTKLYSDTKLKATKVHFRPHTFFAPSLKESGDLMIGIGQNPSIQS